MAKRSSSLSDLQSFLEELRSPDIKPVYAFFGEETFFLDRLQDAAIAVIPEEARDFNLDVLYGDEVKVDKVITMCRSYPMMAERRAVIVRDFMKMFDPRRQ
jgi:DNA polymerase III subunit delta